MKKSFITPGKGWSCRIRVFTFKPSFDGFLMTRIQAMLISLHQNLKGVSSYTLFEDLAHINTKLKRF